MFPYPYIYRTPFTSERIIFLKEVCIIRIKFHQNQATDRVPPITVIHLSLYHSSFEFRFDLLSGRYRAGLAFCYLKRCFLSFGFRCSEWQLMELRCKTSEKKKPQQPRSGRRVVGLHIVWPRPRYLR